MRDVARRIMQSFGPRGFYVGFQVGTRSLKRTAVLSFVVVVSLEPAATRDHPSPSLLHQSLLLLRCWVGGARRSSSCKYILNALFTVSVLDIMESRWARFYQC